MKHAQNDMKLPNQDPSCLHVNHGPRNGLKHFINASQYLVAYKSSQHPRQKTRADIVYNVSCLPHDKLFEVSFTGNSMT